jgi:hypothetical protein
MSIITQCQSCKKSFSIEDGDLISMKMQVPVLTLFEVSSFRRCSWWNEHFLLEKDEHTGI